MSSHVASSVGFCALDTVELSLKYTVTFQS